MANETLRALGRVVAEGAKQVGTRAMAHGMKSIVKDAKRMAGGVERKLAQAARKLEEMTIVDPDPQDDDDIVNRRRD